MTRQQQKPILPPVTDKSRELVRKVAEAAVEIAPGVGLITSVLQVSVPPKSETDREAWQEAISERINQNTGRLDQHERLLNPTTTVTGTAAQVAVALAKACPDGLSYKRFDLDDLSKLLPDTARDEIEDATADLEFLGLVARERMIGPYWSIYLTPAFYLQLDHQIMGWNTITDAVTVARLLLEKDASGLASDLHRQTGWDKRRFNPAFRIVLKKFSNGRISKELQPDYPSPYVELLPEDRSALRRFIAEMEAR
jgi:hypothetical protein